jgi:hypothetical protein
MGFFSEGQMNSRVKSVAAFLFLAFVMKVIGELVHEVMGHGFCVLLFGGEITRVHISLLWPYELSYIVWTGNFEAWQMPWIHGGGILVCLIVSGVLQALLLLGIVKDRRLSASLLWLSFWTFLNPTGYLIMGGIRPFGDVAALIAEGVLTQGGSLLIGVVIFLAAFFSLSKIFKDLIINAGLVRSIADLRVALSLFWLLIPLVTAISCLGMRVPSFYLQIFIAMSLIPVMATFIIASILPAKSCGN